MATFEPATFHIVWAGPQRSQAEPVWNGECKTSDLGKDDIRLLEHVPFRPTMRVFKEYDYLEVYLTTVGSDTVVTADSYVKIPVTFKNIRLGHKYPAYLTAGLLVGENAMTDNPAGLAMTAGEKKMVWYYRVPAGLEMVLGHVVPYNSRICIAPYDDTE